jgi:hypothetical protein
MQTSGFTSNTMLTNYKLLKVLVKKRQITMREKDPEFTKGKKIQKDRKIEGSYVEISSSFGNGSLHL